MKKFVKEFKEFISRGNVLEMAVGIIIGSAFTGIVTALTDDIINPLISLATGGNGTTVSGLKWAVGPDTYLDLGAFISAVLNFLIIALVLFSIIKAANKFQEAEDKLLHIKHEEEAAEPKAVCPHCLEEVKPGATRCPHCAGEIPGGAQAK